LKYLSSKLKNNWWVLNINWQIFNYKTFKCLKAKINLPATIVLFDWRVNWRIYYIYVLSINEKEKK